MVRCIFVPKGYKDLTLGKIYEWHGVCGAWYWTIKDDSGFLVNYNPKYFEIIE